MDVMSVELCVQAVIGAYRDASKLTQRLKNKQKTSEDFILPEDLTKEFEDSLTLGCVAVQSQYDHDVRRFGETYARGDSTAREQMKDILITLQHEVISHLREVFMDDATLDLHAVKETSDDSRVNAIVCLGQLYQRMSTATAAMKQISRPYIDEPDKGQHPGSLAYSSSRSTHSSAGAMDAQSATSYTTYSSRTAVAHDRKPSGGPAAPQRRISLTSAFSYSSEREQQPSRLTPGEDNIPALPYTVQRQTSQGTADSTNTTAGHSQHTDERESPSNASSSPPPYKPNPSLPMPTSDEKGHSTSSESNTYQPPAAPETHHNSLPQSPARQQSPQASAEEATLLPSSRRSPLAAQFQVHELDNSPAGPGESQAQHRDRDRDRDRDQHLSIPRSPPATGQGQRQQNVPLNPEYSTLEYVQALDARSRAAGLQTSTSDHAYQQYLLQQQQHQQFALQHAQQHPHAQQSLQYGYHPNYPMMQGQPMMMMAAAPASRPPMNNAGTGSSSGALHGDPGPLQRVPTMSTPSRPLSIRSTASTSSKVQAYVLRKGLPPGIVEAFHKPAPSPLEAQLNSQPRYVRPAPLDLHHHHHAAENAGHHHPGRSAPLSPIAQRVDSVSDGTTETTSASDTVSLESTMRVAAAASSSSSQMQVTRAQLNLPSEGNLLGFCKGAVRQQLAVKKKGFSLEHRKGPKGLEYFFQCTKCNFEGPAIVSTALPSGGRGAVKREKTFDARVRISEGGIRYRWAFLAKSHVQKKLAVGDALNSGDVYGCYFCCAEGAAKGWVDGSLTAQLATLGTFGDKKAAAAAVNTTPTFHGLAAFMAHLETHRISSRMPGLIVANEINCIVGRVAHEHEDFDLNLPPLGA